MLNSKLQKTDVYHYVDCGKCYECISKRKNQWAFRCNEEFKVSSDVKFVTLTYNNENLPIYGVDIRDVQLFFKRLRKYISTHYQEYDKPLKYYCSSEYGTKYNRPHYHMILFNCPLGPMEIENVWQKGFIKSFDTNLSTIQYVLKYFANKDLHPFEKHKNFVTMSKNMGLSFVINNPEYSKNYVRLLNFKIAIPRYYQDKYNKIDLKNRKKVRYPKTLTSDYDLRNNLESMFSRKFLRYQQLTVDKLYTLSVQQLDNLLSLQREYHKNDNRKIKRKWQSINKDNQ